MNIIRGGAPYGPLGWLCMVPLAKPELHFPDSLSSVLLGRSGHKDKSAYYVGSTSKTANITHGCRA